MKEINLVNIMENVEARKMSEVSYSCGCIRRGLSINSWRLCSKHDKVMSKIMEDEVCID